MTKIWLDIEDWITDVVTGFTDYEYFQEIIFAIMVITVLALLRKLFKKKQSNDESEMPEKQNVSESVDIQDEVEIERMPKFCSSCGTEFALSPREICKLPKIFCDRCGQQFRVEVIN